MDKRLVAPEWVTTSREDVLLDDALQGGWGVSYAPLVRNASFTDFGTHEMAVPSEDTPEGGAVRLHELIHARISPTSVPQELMTQLGITQNAIRLAEEVRVNAVGRCSADRIRATLHPEDQGAVMDTVHLTDGSEKELAKLAVEKNNWNDALSLYLNTYNTTVHKAVKRRLRTRHEWRDTLKMIDDKMYAHNVKLSDGSARAHGFLADTEPMEFSWVDSKKVRQQTLLPRGFVRNTLALANDIDQWMTSPPHSTKGAGKEIRKSRLRKWDNDNWEVMRFGLSALTETTTAFLGKRKRPSMTGKYPSRPDRLLTDPERRIFRVPVRSKGGIVIFDCSGSMGVTHETILDTVKQFAGATVLVYSHSSTASANAWIVAKNGRMISRDDFNELPLNNGNGIDGEVLRWAVRNRKHGEFILWVSDGQVTGKHDRMGQNLVKECALLSAKHDIIGVDDCEEALEVLKKMKQGKIPSHHYCRVIGYALEEINKGAL